jgi:arginase
MAFALSVFQGRAGDHNDRGFGGAAAIGAEWQHRLGLPAVTIGTPEPPLSAGWREELAAAVPALAAMSNRYEEIYAAGQTPWRR